MGIVAKLDTLRSLAFGSISGTYAAVGAALTHPANMFRIINATNGDMLLSIGGTIDNFFVPANSFVLYDVATNKAFPDRILKLAVGDRFYVKQSTAPSSGSVYIEIVYSN